MITLLSQALERQVKNIALPEGRKVGTAGHDRARTYLGKQLHGIGCAPYTGNSFELPYRCGGQDFCNLAGVVHGKDRDKAPVLIGAHYDSVIEAPCADDNAAAVAMALEVARRLRSSPPERDVIIALFDAEEPPYFETSSMGCVRFYEDQMKARGLHALLVMDLVGHEVQLPLCMVPGMLKFSKNGERGIPIPRLRNLLFVTGAESHPCMPKLLEQIGRPFQLPTIFAPNRLVGDMSDHGVFRRNGIPFLFLSCGRWQHYHQPSDTPPRLCYPKMAKITRYSEALIRGLANKKLPASEITETETIDLEIKSLKNALGLAYMPALKILGIKRLSGRDDLDELANRLLALGL